MHTTIVRLRTSSPEHTRGVGAAIADLLRPGDVVALSGELGAGKTCFVQGAASGLGVAERVTSPTFVLVRLYEGRVPIVHCDVYRLDLLQDVYDLGDEVLAPDVVTFVEWADAVAPLLPTDRLEVELRSSDVEVASGDAEVASGDAEVASGDAERTITVAACGRWQQRAAELSRVLAPWSVEGA